MANNEHTSKDDDTSDDHHGDDQRKNAPRNNWLRDDCRAFYQEQLVKDNASRIGTRVCVIRYSLNHAWTLKTQGRCGNAPQFLEFGCHEGKDMCRMAAFIHRKDSEWRKKKKNASSNSQTIIHGFDSFTGLPEEWNNGQQRQDGTPLFQAGSFDVKGQTPQMKALWDNLKFKKKSSTNNKDDLPQTTTTASSYPDNCQFHKGWFHDTVPLFFDSHPEPVAFVHADADLYSSTLTFLTELCQRKLLVKGSVVTFDEFWNYENWQQGEYKAWTEVVAQYDLQYRYLCYHAPSENNVKDLNWYGYQSVTVVILKDM